MGETCNDNRFKIIEKAKKDILESTNINTSPDEMKVLDHILFRCWQMGWLDKYNSDKNPTVDGIYAEFFAIRNGNRYNANITNLKDMTSVLTNSLMDGIEKIAIKEIWKKKL